MKKILPKIVGYAVLIGLTLAVGFLYLIMDILLVTVGRMGWLAIPISNAISFSLGAVCFSLIQKPGIKMEL